MLSEAQQEAQKARGHVVVAACPGSGKTTVLKHRAQFLLEGDMDAKLAAVTFTKEAAASLKARIAAQYPAGGKRVIAGTFHALCMEQLRQAGHVFKNPKPSTLNQLIQNGMNTLAEGTWKNYKHEDFKNAIERWQRMLEPDLGMHDPMLAHVYNKYTEQKLNHGIKDFNDCIRDAVLGMKAGKVAPLPVSYMLVDEFQDTDAMQLEWVLEHAKIGVEITIVGDDDQAIYGFRGSLGYDGMLGFETQTKARMINLDRTYRCPVEVLRPAALLISCNIARVPKNLITECRVKGAALARRYESREHEIEAVLDAILESGEPDKWAVLARNNAQLDEIDARAAGRVKVNRKESDNFWELKGPAHLMSLAQSMVDRNLLGITELMALCGQKVTDIDHIAVHYESNRRGSLDRFIKAESSNPYLADLQRRARTWSALIASSTETDIKLALSGMAQYIFDKGPWKKSEVQAMANRLQAGTRSIASLKGTMSERLRILTRNNEKSGDGVSLLTLHGSKGLEFENVWIVGVERGVIPSTREGTDTDEERRLLYVGMTRSMKNLTVSFAGEPSPFLIEASMIGSGTDSLNPHERMRPNNHEAD